VKIKIAWIGKTKDRAIQSLTAEYLKRLSRYGGEGAELRNEAALLRLASGAPRGVRHALVLLDSGGRQLSSEQLAAFLDQHATRNPLPLLFAIGPANGFSAETRRAATTSISFGPITLPHELARVVLLEQIYRACTILKGHPYHLGH
jgi:23S rRNA (pseudouridine1915-N3)-methyltransferase